MKQVGFISSIDPTLFHVTLANETAKLCWNDIPKNYSGMLEIDNINRKLSSFDNNAIVLEISSEKLENRWNDLQNNGTRWKWDNYKPHVTLTYSCPDNLEQIIPYDGPIILGSEIFNENRGCQEYKEFIL